MPLFFGPNGGLVRKNSTPRSPMVRGAGAPPPSNKAVINSSHLTYRGAFRIPRVSGGAHSEGETFNGWGLTYKYTPSDVGFERHLVLLARTGNAGYLPYEIRIPTPVIPSVPGTLSNYPQVNIYRAYGGSQLGANPTHRSMLYGTSDTTLGPINNDTDGMFGVYWDPIDERLYHTYGFGYAGNGVESNSPSLMYWDNVNPTAGTMSPHGPWRFLGQSWKALMGGIMPVPTSFADAYLSGKRLGVGWGGYFSLEASADCSLGPNITAIDPPDPSTAPATPQTDINLIDLLANQCILGYWPKTANLALDINVESFGYTRRNLIDYASVGDNGWTRTDRTSGGVWIDNTTVHGVMFAVQFGIGQLAYVGSGMAAEGYRMAIMVYDPDDIRDVAIGDKLKHQISPTHFWEICPPILNYETNGPYAMGLPESVVTQIVSNPADGKDEESTDPTRGCVATFPAGFGTFPTDVNCASIDLGDRTNEYNHIWFRKATTLPNTLKLYDPNDSAHWSGTTWTGSGTMRGANAAPKRYIGMAYDPENRELFLASNIKQGSTGLNTQVLVECYGVED